MTEKNYNYPAPIKFSKLISYFVIILGVGLLIYNLGKNNLQVIPVLILVGFMFLWFPLSWPNVKITDDGLYVEFLWTYLHVPWKNIITLKLSNAEPFGGVWLVIVDDKLTLLHYLFGIFYNFSVVRAFLIHPQAKSQRELIETIRRFIRKI